MPFGWQFKTGVHIVHIVHKSPALEFPRKKKKPKQKEKRLSTLST
jgi:hypothetical protein